MNLTTARLVMRLAQRARKVYGIKTAVFGDCALVSCELRRLIEENTDLAAKTAGGLFEFIPNAHMPTPHTPQL